MPKCQFCKMDIPHGATSCPSCGATVPVSGPASTDLEQQVRSLLAQGKRLEAVKIYKTEVGCSLKEAKDAVEALERGDGPPQTGDSNSTMQAPPLYNMRTILPDGSYKTGEDGKPIQVPTPNADSGLLFRPGHQANLWCWACGSVSGRLGYQGGLSKAGRGRRPTNCRDSATVGVCRG